MKYDAVIFDLLTALIDSWSLWNDVAGSPDAGMKWRRRYLEITYGCGPYRPYETLVREAARDVGLPERLGSELERRWGELAPWPEARGVLSTIPPQRTLFVAGSASDVPGAKGVGMPVFWHNRVGLPPRDDARPDHLEPTLDTLAGLFARN